MQSYPILSSTTVDRATQQLISAAAGLGDGAAREAKQLVLRLAPNLWPLEWHLPFWLGSDFGLAETVWQQLVTVNLLGAGYVRLADDLADERLEEPRRAAKTVLSQRLLEMSTGLLAALFEPASPLWRRYETYLAQWRQAGTGEEAWRDAGRERLTNDWQWLAWRGAPAKITATGGCLLAGRDGQIAPLEMCIDHAMAATVLLDHADDWRDDLSAGRFNTYMAWLTGLPQSPENAAENRQWVLSAVMQGDGARHLSYYRLVDQHLVEAHSAARLVGSTGLSAYLAAFRQDAHNQSQGHLAAARKTLADALASLLADFEDVNWQTQP